MLAQCTANCITELCGLALPGVRVDGNTTKHIAKLIDPSLHAKGMAVF